MLLLPTRFWLLGACLAVAASFLLLALAPPAWVERLARLRLRLGTLPRPSPTLPSLLSLALLALLVAAGLFGSHDPLHNPLPLFVWTLWWVGFTLLQALTGQLWSHLNPWSGPLALLRRFTRSAVGRQARLRLPAAAGYAIATAQFFAFAWFELIDPAPSDPRRLAFAVSGYWLLNLAGMMLYGEAAWAKCAEPFGIFFRLVGGLSPIAREPGARPSQVALSLVWPGRSLIEREALPLPGTLFVLLTLASVSFDGLSRTYRWLALTGVNPLEFPGRSAVMVPGTIGLAVAWVVLAAALLAAIAGGWRLAGGSNPGLAATGRLVFSIVPISLAFHASHYLTMLLVDGQYARIALSDPFALGWDLFGTARDHVTLSFLNRLEGVAMVWSIQTVTIAFGHILGIVMAHMLALRLLGEARAAIRSQLILANLMVLYTAFGLWLLATPRI